MRGKVAIAIDPARTDEVSGQLQRIFQGHRAALAPSLVARLWDILALYEAEAAGRESGLEEGLDPRLRIVEALLHANMHEPLCVDYLAEQAGVSTSQLHRLYKKHLNETVHQRLQRLRLELARDLLRYSSLRMNEIARRCGFKDATHFSFLFKKREGVPPMQFRRESERRKGSVAISFAQAKTSAVTVCQLPTHGVFRARFTTTRTTRRLAGHLQQRRSPGQRHPRPPQPPLP